jgi:hypothetical protein
MRYLGVLPLACYAALVVYACYAWIQIGHWPYYAHPDPKELPNRSLLSIASVMFLMGALSVIVIPFAYSLWRVVAVWRKWPISPHRAPVVLYLAGLAFWSLDYVAVFADLPWTSTISWLLD